MQADYQKRSLKQSIRHNEKVLPANNGFYKQNAKCHGTDT